MLTNRYSQPYRFILFDMDDTLFDHSRSSRLALEKLYEKYKIGKQAISLADFFDCFAEHNLSAWKAYGNGLIDASRTRVGRWERLIDQLGIEGIDPPAISEDYLSSYMERLFLMEGAIDVLQYLKPRYPLAIITNGFRDIQSRKMDAYQLWDFFEYFLCSEEVGVGKPNLEFFKHALQKIKASNHECIYIGDSVYSDVAGANRADIDLIWYNPRALELPHGYWVRQQIEDLRELMQLL